MKQHRVDLSAEEIRRLACLAATENTKADDSSLERGRRVYSHALNQVPSAIQAVPCITVTLAWL